MREAKCGAERLSAPSVAAPGCLIQALARDQFIVRARNLFYRFKELATHLRPVGALDACLLERRVLAGGFAGSCEVIRAAFSAAFQQCAVAAAGTLLSRRHTRYRSIGVNMQRSP